MASLLERKRRVMMPCLYHFYGDDPVELVRGVGTEVWDRAGRKYLDFYAGVAVNGLGHCHPEVVAAATDQLGVLQHTTTIYLTEPMIALAERLIEKAPSPLSRVFFCADGSGAIEGALIAARQATGRRDFLAFENGLHGRTSLSLAVTGIDMWRVDPYPPAVVHRLSVPQQDAIDAAIIELRQVIEQAEPDSIAAMILEPVQGNGGIHVMPFEYLRAARALLDEFGILLIVDEVQTGFGRTGRWFGIEHAEVSPDLMAVAKAMTNGLPAAAWLASESVARHCTRPAASTFGGNLVPMATGLKVMEILERDGLVEQSHTRGTEFCALLNAIAKRHNCISEVRGLGLMIGVELIEGDGEPGTELCDKVLREMRVRGVLAGKTGTERNVLTFEPPLIATSEEIARVAEVFEGALCHSLAEAPCC